MAWLCGAMTHEDTRNFTVRALLAHCAGRRWRAAADAGRGAAVAGGWSARSVLTRLPWSRALEGGNRPMH